jgi:hypothetical protein
MSVKEDSGINAVELADKTGVAVVKVKDGHVLVFTKAHIQGMLDEMEKSGQEKCLVFVKDILTKN